MVAEQFIFLSSDRLVNVRCCVMDETPLFCVKDFIRRTANQRMGPLDALQYWMSISLTLLGEKDIAVSHMHRFPGPYEKPSVCINANGLLVLLHHMDQMYSSLVNPTYRAEVNARLQEVIGGSGDKYIEDYDDGEVDAQVEEDVFGQPPADSRFWYAPAVGGEDAQAALARLAEQNERLQTQLALQTSELAALKRNGERESELLKRRIAELEDEAASARDPSFSLPALIRDLELRVPANRIKTLCKRVVKLFRDQHPGVGVNKRHQVAVFKPDDRECVELLLRHVHLQMDLEAAEKWRTV
jgi:hypothetical protein